MTIRPTSDNIFVQVDKEKDGIIHVPPVFKRRHQICLSGVVVYCGPGSKIKKGDKIVFSKTEDNRITVNGKELLLIKPHAILAVK